MLFEYNVIFILKMKKLEPEKDLYKKRTWY